MSKLDLKMKLPTDAEIDKMFAAVPQLQRFRVADKAVRAGAKPIVKRARQLAPRSTPAMRAKRSRSQREAADWNYPLWKTIAVVVRKYSHAAGLAVIGPRWPKGNKAYFNTSPRGRREVLWGHRTGRVVSPIRNWIVQAFDETRGEQLREVKASLKKSLHDMWT